MIISSGYNIAGPEVEAALLSHADVLECAVIGVSDKERGMIGEAQVVLAKGRTASDELAKRLQDHVKAAIAPYKYPRRTVFVEAMPKTQTGKIQRFRLRQEGRGQSLNDQSRNTPGSYWTSSCIEASCMEVTGSPAAAIVVRILTICPVKAGKPSTSSPMSTATSSSVSTAIEA